ncbi:hypothetical protein AAHA92_29043 [Salvia divinorum]|uniref:Uncharacterized protein n=1 Tax=Salvia divinorum TaxID=28513 RepID=A0ABD1FZK7_SALDI
MVVLEMVLPFDNSDMVVSENFALNRRRNSLNFWRSTDLHLTAAQMRETDLWWTPNSVVAFIIDPRRSSPLLVYRRRN